MPRPHRQKVDVKLSAWRRLPSQINYTPEGDFLPRKLRHTNTDGERK